MKKNSNISTTLPPMLIPKIDHCETLRYCAIFKSSHYYDPSCNKGSVDLWPVKWSYIQWHWIYFFPEPVSFEGLGPDLSCLPPGLGSAEGKLDDLASSRFYRGPRLGPVFTYQNIIYPRPAPGPNIWGHVANTSTSFITAEMQLRAGLHLMNRHPSF